MTLRRRIFAATTVTVALLFLVTVSGARAADVNGLHITSATHFGLTSSQLARLDTRSRTSDTFYIWEVNGISCARHNDCEAIGWSSRIIFNIRLKAVRAVSVAFAEHWNGTRWSAQRVVNPGRGTELMSISCYSPNNCTAVGAYGPSFVSTARTKPVIEHWNGVRWRQVAIGALKAKDSQDVLYSVSCTVFGQCTALGGIEALKTGRIRTYSERFDGINWSRAAAPADGLATDVSCPQWGDCFALSSTELGVEHEQNNRWVKQKFALPKHVMFVAFASLSCGSPNDCVASGLYASLKRSGRKIRISGGPIFEHFNGKRWSRMLLPQSAYASGAFSADSVSCSSNGHCVASGNIARHGFQTLVLRNGKWRVVDVSGNDTSVISCPDFDYCVASNLDAVITETPTFPLTKRLDLDSADASIFNGHRWRPVVMRLPSFSLRFTLK